MKRLGTVMRIGGIVIMVFSYFILFLVIEPIIGMERIVGKENVIREKDGGYLYTNPFAVWAWVAGIILVGFIINRRGRSLLERQSKQGD